jgi:hypothetical protein
VSLEQPAIFETLTHGYAATREAAITAFAQFNRPPGSSTFRPSTAPVSMLDLQRVADWAIVSFRRVAAAVQADYGR